MHGPFSPDSKDAFYVARKPIYAAETLPPEEDLLAGLNSDSDGESTDKRRYTGFSCVIPFGKWELYEPVLQELDNLSYYIGQRELSEKGFDHVQLLIVVKVKRALPVFVKQSRLREFDGLAEAVRNVWTYSAYCMKAYSSADEKFVYGPVPNRILQAADRKKSQDDKFRSLMACKTREEAMEYVETELPQQFVVQHAAMTTFINKKFEEVDGGSYSISAFCLPPFPVSDGTTYVFVGAAGYGKTQFALAHFTTPLLVSDRQDFGKLVRGTYDGVVIDDMNFNKWNCSNLIHLTDQAVNRTINVKYGSVCFPKGMPRIITLNSLKSFWPENMLKEQRPALERRTTIIRFTRPLFRRAADEGGADDSQPPFVNVTADAAVVRAGLQAPPKDFNWQQFRKSDDVELKKDVVKWQLDSMSIMDKVRYIEEGSRDLVIDESSKDRQFDAD